MTSEKFQTPNIPIACNLNSTSLEARKGLFAELIARAAERIEQADGYTFLFQRDTVTVTELANVIEFERQCCRFLRFVVTVESADGPISLELSGLDGTKQFLSGLLSVPKIEP